MRELLQESVEGLFRDAIDQDLLRKAEDGAFPTSLWAATENLGLPLAAVSEDLGGSGAAWSDLFVAAKACGYYAAPIPLMETVLGNWLLASSGLQPAESGVVTVATAVDPSTVDLPWGREARVLVTVDPVRRLVRRFDVQGSASRSVNQAGEPRDRIAELRPVGEAPLHQDLDPLRLGGAMIRSAQAAGALERVLDMTTQYALDRVQFGRPIGKFQAVQHQLAELATHAAAVRAAADAAFARADNGFDPFPIAAARIAAGEASAKCAAIAHQVHAAIGFTHEHALHFFTRRLWSWRTEFGTDAAWAEDLGRAVCARGSGALWATIAADTFEVS